MSEYRQLPHDRIAVKAAIAVRTYDIDALGHVSNITYIRWLEDLRFQLFESNFGLSAFKTTKTNLVLRSTHIEYIRGVKLFDAVSACMFIAQASRSTIILQAQFDIEGKLTTEASQVGVFVDQESLRPKRIPDFIASRF